MKQNDKQIRRRVINFLSATYVSRRSFNYSHRLTFLMILLSFVFVISAITAVPTKSSTLYTVRDEFNNVAYDGNDGTANWSGDWVEFGDNGAPNGQHVGVYTDIDNYQLIVRNNNRGIYRSVDLSAATTATLTFDYRMRSLSNSSQYVTLEISSNGPSGPWTEIDRFEGAANEPDYTTISYDISSYISSQTTIQLTAFGMSGGNRVLFDNIEIAFDEHFSPTATLEPTPPPPEGDLYILRDEFNSIAYDGNDGTANWSSDWIEFGDNDDPNGQDVGIYTDIDNYQLIVRNNEKGILRTADLYNANAATLKFDFRRRSLSNASQYVTLEIFSSYSGEWTELDRFVGPANDSGYTSVSYDISDYVSNRTTIRLTAFGMSGGNRILFDNVEIEYYKQPFYSTADPVRILAPADDASVQAANPTNNYGSDTELFIEASDYYSYIKFEVPEFSDRVISRAMFWLYVGTGEDISGALFEANSNVWEEHTITYNNAPTLGAEPLAQFEDIAGNIWLGFDVTSIIEENQTITFGLIGTSADIVEFYSKEASSNTPELILVLGEDGGPPGGCNSSTVCPVIGPPH